MGGKGSGGAGRNQGLNPLRDWREVGAWCHEAARRLKERRAHEAVGKTAIGKRRTAAIKQHRIASEQIRSFYDYAAGYYYRPRATRLGLRKLYAKYTDEPRARRKKAKAVIAKVGRYYTIHPLGRLSPRDKQAILHAASREFPLGIHRIRKLWDSYEGLLRALEGDEGKVAEKYNTWLASRKRQRLPF